MDPPPCFVFRTIWNHVFALCFVALLSATIKNMSFTLRQSGDLVIGSSGDRIWITRAPDQPSSSGCNPYVLIFGSSGSDHPITRDLPIFYFAPVLPTFFFNFSPT